MKKNVSAIIYQVENTVFSLNELAILLEEKNFNNLKAAANYYVKNKILWNLRRGIYAKENFNPYEMAVKIYSPAYIGFETVLFNQGIVFQYDRSITMASYLSREIKVGGYTLRFRKLKGPLLSSPEGLDFFPFYTIAQKERALLDMLYINPLFHVDNLRQVDRKKIMQILPVYESTTLEKRIQELLK